MRQYFETEGLSSEGAKLMFQSRKEGTVSKYEEAGKNLLAGAVKSKLILFAAL